MKTRAFQSRLGAKADKLRRKLFNNSVSLTGSVIDFIGIRLKKTKQGDIASRTIERVGILEVVFPPMVDIPMRRVINDAGNLYLNSLSVEEVKPIEVQVPSKYVLDQDDLLFWVLQDEDVDRPLVLALEVKDTKYTIGSHSTLWKKYICTIYDQQLPAEVLSLITDAQERRVILGW